jgi:hypothetical protein
MFLGNPLTAQVLVPPTLTETSVAPLTAYPCFEPVINCDMLHRGGNDVLKAITWDNGTRPPIPGINTISCANAAPGTNQAYVFVEDWVGNQLIFTLPTDSKQPDIVLADDMQNPGVDYFIGVVYVTGPNILQPLPTTPPSYTQNGQKVNLDVYRLKNAGTAGMAVTLHYSYQVPWLPTYPLGDIDLVAHQGHPHIDMWSDVGNPINGLPSMHRYAISWTQNDINGNSVARYFHDEIANTPPFPLPFYNLPVKAYMSDVACHTTPDGDEIINIGTSDNGWKHLFYNAVNTTLGTISTPLLLDTNVAIFPRIEAMSQAQPGSVTWQVVASIHNPFFNPNYQVFSYNDLNVGAPEWLSDSNVLGFNTDYKAAAVAAGTGMSISGDIGNTQYTTGFYDWFTKQNIYSRAIDVNSGWTIDPNFYQVNNKPLSNVTWDIPHIYAVSNCSNSGYGLLSAYTADNSTGGVKYKYSGNVFQYKIAAINPTATKMQWILYPNPATNQLTITGLKEHASYTIYNMVGSILQEGNTLGNVNLSSLPSGSYSITLKAGCRIETKRFVKH